MKKKCSSSTDALLRTRLSATSRLAAFKTLGSRDAAMIRAGSVSLFMRPHSPIQEQSLACSSACTEKLSFKLRPPLIVGSCDRGVWMLSALWRSCRNWSLPQSGACAGAAAPQRQVEALQPRRSAPQRARSDRIHRNSQRCRSCCALIGEKISGPKNQRY